MTVTPGPWAAHPVPNDRLERWLVTAPGAGVGKPVVAEKIRTEGNARLIAAAPALLALARGYASECAECGGSCEIVKNRGSGDPIDDYSVECDKCLATRAVIDVATKELL